MGQMACICEVFSPKGLVFLFLFLWDNVSWYLLNDIQMSNPFEHYISVSTCSGMMCIACKKSKKMRKIHKIIFYLFSEIHTIPFPKLLVSKFIQNNRGRVGILTRQSLGEFLVLLFFFLSFYSLLPWPNLSQIFS